LAILLFAAALSACGSGSGDRRDEAPSTANRSPATISRIERCVDRLLQDATTRDASEEEEARRYARNTYCARFERKRWIYEDGALSIAAQTWLEEGARCATGGEGEPTRTVSCEEERRAGVRTLDCALLHIVRRSEVRDYIERLRSNGAVECDDGTALDELGFIGAAPECEERR